MDKKVVKSNEFTTITYCCPVCRNRFEGIVRKQAGSVRLKCSYCGNSLVVFI